MQLQGVDLAPLPPCPPPLLPISITYADSPAPDTGISVMHRRDGTALTSVSLCQVRRMHFSMGVNGRSRAATEISGIRLEYYHSVRPAIAGQWLSEVDSFEIGQDEHVTDISVWLSVEGVSQWGRAKLGRVIGLLLVTSQLRRKCVITRSLAGTLRLNFRAKRFEDLVRVVYIRIGWLDGAKFDLSQDTLLWAFNTRWDHFRVLPRPAVGHGSLLLYPESSPPWLVPEKALWEERDADGNILKLLSITAHLKDRAITGLTFLYDSGLIHKIGFTEGKTSEKIVFSKHERLIHLEVRSSISTIHSITVSFYPAPNTAPTS